MTERQKSSLKILVTAIGIIISFVGGVFTGGSKYGQLCTQLETIRQETIPALTAEVQTVIATVQEKEVRLREVENWRGTVDTRLLNIENDTGWIRDRLEGD